MQEKLNSFWKYAGSLKSATKLEDAFIKWAASNTLKLTEAQELWNKVSAMVSRSMKKADVSISGPLEEVLKWQKSDNTGTSTEPPAEAGLPPAMNVEPAEEEKPAGTLFDSLGDEGGEEESAEGLPPLPGGAPTPGGAQAGAPEGLPPLPTM